MTETITQMRWRALDREGEDKCRLAHLDAGYMLVGHARFRESDGTWAALDYVVRTDATWRTLSADVTGTVGGAELAVKIVRGETGWRLGDEIQPQLSGCEDVDFSFTPATNLMPLRRLPDVGRLTTRAAWLRLPSGDLRPLDQSYTRERGGIIAYAAEQTAFATQLVVNECGFVTTYPNLWEADA